MPPVEALKFLDERQNRMSGVPQDVFKSVMDTLTEGLNEGESIKELSDRVRNEFNGMAKERATTIAMTETAAAYGTARQTAMKQAGIQFKKWLTSGNDNVRMAHRMMNGATVPIDAPFVVINPKTGSVDHVQHPADPEGEPWNVINCHCVSLARAEGPKQTAEATE
jgi:SPP1 gp7 family putative phage head morphogenesis protein